jgi:hypothetical protein
MNAPLVFDNGQFTTKAEGDTMWQRPLARLPEPRRLDALEAATAMFDDGCVQFPDFLTPDEVGEMRAWMDRCGGPDEQYEVPNWCFNRHLTMQPHREPMWLRLIDRDPVYDCLRHVLGEGLRVGTGSMWTTGKGRCMGLHVDGRPVTLPEEMLADPRVRLPILASTLQIYLDDQVEEIGATVVVTGSWRSGRHPKDEGAWNGRMPQMVSVKAGGAVLFRPDLWHGAEMNSSTRRRYMLQIHYVSGFRRQLYPTPFFKEHYAPEVLANATPRQLALYGGMSP